MALFPIFVIQGTARQVESLENDRLTTNLLAEQNRFLTTLGALDDDAICLKIILKNYFRAMKDAVPARREMLVSQFHRRYPGMADLFFFDGTKRLVQEISSKSRSRRAAELSFAAIVDLGLKKSVPEGLRGLVAQFLNVESLSLFIPNRGAVSDLGPRDRERYFVVSWEEAPTRGGLAGYVAFFHPSMIPGNFFMKRMIDHANRTRRGMTAAMALVPDLAAERGTGGAAPRDGVAQKGKTQTVVFHPPELIGTAELAGAFLKAAPQFDTHFTAGNNTVSFAPRRHPGWLLTMSATPRFFSDRIYYIINVISLVWLLFVCFRIPAGGQGWGTPIPAKLLGVFLFGVGIPSLIMLVVGYYALKDHTSVLQQKLELQVQEKIKQFDAKLRLEIQTTERRLKSIVAEASNEENAERRLDVYKQFLAEKPFDMLMVIDQKGREIFNFPRFKKDIERDPGKKKMGQFVTVLAREFIKRMNKNLTIDAGTLVMEATGNMLSTFIGGTGQRNGVDEIIRNRGMMYPLALGGDSSFLFINGVTNSKMETIEIVAGLAPASNIESLFILRNIHNLKRQPDLRWRVHAFGEYKTSRERYKPRILTDDRDEDLAYRFAQVAMRGHAIVKKIVSVRGRKELWMALRGDNFKIYTFVAAVPLEPLVSSEKASWILLLSLAAFLIVVAVVLGSFLSEQFLRPINDLNRGILAIQSREFEHRIPEHAPDELGRMASLMNQVMEGMKDLEMAKTVQESLFPQDALEIGHYRIFGQSRAMADIGGDYFDYFPVSTGEIAGIVGDVSGHGVAAALIMGMAKCAFTMSSKQKPTLLENLAMFNEFMLATVKKKKMMTMFHFLLDTGKHIVEYANAGHNYPVYYTAGTGAVTMLETGNCFPLGISKKFKAEAKSISMLPGDALLLYTDGLVEASGPDQEQIGYERMLEWFRETAHASPEEVVAHMFRRLSEATDMSRPNDDISIICLKRQV